MASAGAKATKVRRDGDSSAHRFAEYRLAPRKQRADYAHRGSRRHFSENGIQISRGSAKKLHLVPLFTRTLHCSVIRVSMLVKPNILLNMASGQKDRDHEGEEKGSLRAMIKARQAKDSKNPSNMIIGPEYDGRVGREWWESGRQVRENNSRMQLSSNILRLRDGKS